MAREKPPAERTGTAPVRPDGKASEVRKSDVGDISAFLDKVRETPSRPQGNGRLVFALDATMSRQPTWDEACSIQAEMFEEAGRIGGLDIQLLYFRGFGECRASKWVSDARGLASLMTRIDCRGGHTQIGKVLKHALGETRSRKIQAMVYVGDCMEENADTLCQRAGELGMLGVPVFMFQEGRDAVAEPVFREIARLTGGAYCSFGAGSAARLRELLRAVAAYAAGGRKALAELKGPGGEGARLLIGQMR